MDEATLIRQAREGDEQAYRALYDAHVDRIHRLVHRMAGDEELARDWTQEAFLRAFRRLDQFRGDSAFSTWLHSVAVSVALNGLRRVERRRERELGLEDVPPLPVGGSRPEPDLRDRLTAAVDGLPDIYRTVFLMHDLEGYKHKEIAETLDVAVGTSKARLFRAREKLRDALGEAMGEYV